MGLVSRLAGTVASVVGAVVCTRRVRNAEPTAFTLLFLAIWDVEERTITSSESETD